jgi:hypothetical protein
MDSNVGGTDYKAPLDGNSPEDVAAGSTETTAAGALNCEISCELDNLNALYLRGYRFIPNAQQVRPSLSVIQVKTVSMMR